MLTSEKVKKYARSCGADLVGVTSMDRFAGAPPQMDPRHIFPDAQSMLVMGFRHFRGLFRGIEEGTFFSAYAGTMGYAGINFVYQPLVLWQVGKMIEDQGYEVIPIPNNFPFTNINYHGWDPQTIGQADPDVSRPVSPGKPAPDVFLQIRIAAFCAGLGEIGYSKMFLSPEFGPRQRLAAIITDAPLNPDPLFDGRLCDQCMSCVRACPVQAIPQDKTVQITVAGHKLEWADIDMHKCAFGFCCGNQESNPFMVTPEDKKKFTDLTHQPLFSISKYKVPPVYSYARALGGGAGCLRACFDHLEKTGKIKNLFQEPFHRRESREIY